MHKGVAITGKYNQDPSDEHTFILQSLYQKRALESPKWRPPKYGTFKKWYGARKRKAQKKY